MYTLYIANKNYSSWSLRAWLLLTERAIPFKEVLMPFGSGPAGVGFKAFSPSGRVPCLVDGDTTVWDSLAIAEYVAELHPTVWPTERHARAWARSASAEMHSGFGEVRNQCSMNCGLRVRMESMSPALLADWARIDALWNDGLSRFGGPFLAGPAFSAVDAFFAPVAFRIQTYSPTLSAAAHEYAARLLALPGMQHWYADALAETWRDAGHEADAAAAGVIVDDLRAR
jgi:glutathione S-transferase